MSAATQPKPKLPYESETIPNDPLTAALQRLAARTPQQIARDRETARGRITPGRPLPEGKNLFEVIGGAWPGDETDEQINAALERLS